MIMKKKLLNFCLAIIVIIANFNLGFSQLKEADGCKNLAISKVSSLPVKRMVIPYIADTIILDGIKDAAYKDSFRLNSVVYFSSTSTFEVSNYHTHGAVISMGWRKEGIYLFATVTDNTDYGGANWSQDGVQIDIDTDTTLDNSCGDWTHSDWEIGINRDTNTVRYSIAYEGDAYHAIVPGDSASNDTAGYWGTTFIYYGHHVPGVRFASISNPYTGYTVEVLYPWAFLVPEYLNPGITVDSIVKRTMGFDIAVADNIVQAYNPVTNSSNGRDHSLIWDQDGGVDSTATTGLNADAVNNNTKLMGRITFQRNGTAINNIVTKGNFSMFPNPANDIVNFDNLTDVTSLDFINIYGQTVKTIKVSSSSVRVNTSDLGKGCYLVRATNVSGNSGVSKLLIK